MATMLALHMWSGISLDLLQDAPSEREAYSSTTCLFLNGLERCVHQQRLAHLPPTAQPDSTLLRGRELLSPSILSKQQTTGEKVVIPGAAAYMCPATQRSSPLPARHESRIPAQDSMYATMLRCPTTQADMGMRDAAGGFGMASRESFTKNNESIGHSALFDASPCQSQTPADKNTAGRGQWKDRFSVGV